MGVDCELDQSSSGSQFPTGAGFGSIALTPFTPYSRPHTLILSAPQDGKSGEQSAWGHPGGETRAKSQTYGKPANKAPTVLKKCGETRGMSVMAVYSTILIGPKERCSGQGTTDFPHGEGGSHAFFSTIRVR